MNDSHHQLSSEAGGTPAVEEMEGERVLYLCTHCKVAAVLLYSLLSLVAFVGNSLIIAVFFYFRRLRTPTNLLIINLAVADLLISIFCIPLSYWHVIIFENQRWIFGALLCKLFNFLQATAVFLSSWTLVAISFDRFLAIMFVMKPFMRFNRRRALYAILATWIFSMFMALPLLKVNQIERSSSGVETCLERWDVMSFLGNEELIVHTYTSLVFALQYCLPLLVLLLTYTFIGLKMWNSKVPGEHTPRQSTSSAVTATAHANASINSGNSSTNHHHSHHPHSASISNQVLDRRHESVKKLIPMVLMVSALYAGCWLPQNLLMNIWINYDPTITSHPYILYIWWGAHTLAMFHSIINPFIYYNQNKRIKDSIRHLLRFLPCFRHLQTAMTTITGGGGVEKGQGNQGVRIVNFVAYMPVTAGGGRRTLQTTISLSGGE